MPLPIEAVSSRLPHLTGGQIAANRAQLNRMESLAERGEIQKVALAHIPEASIRTSLRSRIHEITLTQAHFELAAQLHLSMVNTNFLLAQMAYQVNR